MHTKQFPPRIREQLHQLMAETKGAVKLSVSLAYWVESLLGQDQNKIISCTLHSKQAQKTQLYTSKYDM